jgi:hypothetical protein
LLSLGINTCNADLSADVEETAEEVRIRVHAENNTTADCADGMRVTLDDALGSRRVIDDRAGAELRVVSPLADPGAAGIGDPVPGRRLHVHRDRGRGRQTSLVGRLLSAQARGQFVLVYVTVHNDGDSPRSFAEEYQYLIDGDGRKSEGYIERGDLLADINPGNTVEGVLVFDIASDAVPAWIELRGSPSSGGVTVALG